MPPRVLTPELERRIAAAQRVVVMSGAGISRESGLATFRGEEGLWERYRPEELATPEAFAVRPGVVWRWYAWRYRSAAAAAPNPAHHACARLAELFSFFTLVTQNVDGLHQRAGSRDVLELHGTVTVARCHRCGRRMEMAHALETSPDHPPQCPCGGLLRPAVVWFGEALPAEVLRRAAEEAARADLFLAVGTSAVVYPAAGLIEVAARAGAAVVEINPEPTPLSPRVHLRLAAPAGEALPALVTEIERCRRSTI